MPKIEEFLAQRRSGKKAKATKEVLSSYQIVTEEHGQTYPSVAGILLFSEHIQKYFPEAYVLCGHFSGYSGRDAIASRNCTGTLFEQFEGAFDFMMDRVNKSFKITGKQREERYEVPPIALREALMNAILHRNYHINAPVKIAIYNNRIEIFSPGNFSGPVDILALETGITYIRNVTIAKILWECRYVEKMGSGFIEIFENYRRAGLVAPEIVEGTNFIKCILPTVKSTVKQLDAPGKILNLLQTEPEISRADVINRLNIPRATAGRLLLNLINEGKLIRLGKGRAVKYRLG